MVGFFMEEAGLRGSLQDGPLKACPDLDALKTKMQRKKAGLMEVGVPAGGVVCQLCCG